MKKKLFTILLVACILFSASSVFAADNDTSISSDESGLNNLEAISNDENKPLEDVGDLIGDEDNGTFTALQLKINLAKEGSEINLTKDYKYNDEFKLTTGIFINKDITINGNGHVIDAMGKSRIFNINYGNGLSLHKVTLKDITFKNGNAKIYGGAILNFADLTIDNCYFTNNNAGTAGGAVNSLGALTLKNSKFHKNSAGGDAGAVFSLTLKKSPEFYYTYFEGKNVEHLYDANTIDDYCEEIIEILKCETDITEFQVACERLIEQSKNIVVFEKDYFYMTAERIKEYIQDYANDNFSNALDDYKVLFSEKADELLNQFETELLNNNKVYTSGASVGFIDLSKYVEEAIKDYCDENPVVYD